MGLADGSKSYVRYAYVGDPIHWWQALGMGLSFWYCWAILFALAYALVRRYPIGSKHVVIPLMVYFVGGGIFAFIKITIDYPVIKTFYCSHPQSFTFSRFYKVAFMGPRFQALTDVDPEVLDARVPLFLLQPVVEEEIRHTLADQQTPGRVTVRARCLDGVLKLQVDAEALGLVGYQPRSSGNENGL